MWSAGPGPRNLKLRLRDWGYLRFMGSISRVISPLIWVISIVTLLITLLITTPEPPSKSPQAQASRNPAKGFVGGCPAPP